MRTARRFFSRGLHEKPALRKLDVSEQEKGKNTQVKAAGTSHALAHLNNPWRLSGYLGKHLTSLLCKVIPLGSLKPGNWRIMSCAVGKFCLLLLCLAASRTLP